jgi:hypothetical protein
MAGVLEGREEPLEVVDHAVAMRDGGRVRGPVLANAKRPPKLRLTLLLPRFEIYSAASSASLTSRSASSLCSRRTAV